MLGKEISDHSWNTKIRVIMERRKNLDILMNQNFFLDIPTISHETNNGDTQ